MVADLLVYMEFFYFVYKSYVMVILHLVFIQYNLYVVFGEIVSYSGLAFLFLTNAFNLQQTWYQYRYQKRVDFLGFIYFNLSTIINNWTQYTISDNYLVANKTKLLLYLVKVIIAV